MISANLVIYILFAHWVADFVAQTDSFFREKPNGV